ncbi:hypothetical protein [Thermococcus sp. LS2]|uniref:hypothetical protein n=1 Tax=Thermococcus sp. LS2 TaxID=1638260 RepID=UPI001438C038|nr:hypothetical protein [Thermococcus sp. LS2]NJE13226.1 hypothetical protein [Thermococcus sp. LS2]
MPLWVVKGFLGVWVYNGGHVVFLLFQLLTLVFHLPTLRELSESLNSQLLNTDGLMLILVIPLHGEGFEIEGEGE